VLLDNGFTVRQAGRVLQRLFEIEVYRLLALLALPIAQPCRRAWWPSRPPWAN
jgi:uncharacterized membrane-anchored protein